MTSETKFARISDDKRLTNDVSLFVSKSEISSEANKTGSWRFARPVYQNKTAPCSAACPAGTDIPRIELLISQGLVKTAWETFLEENPFPSVCGRVCFHTCEIACNRTHFDDAVAINRLERFVGDIALADRIIPELERLPSNGKKVAIAGSGPAGLAAAYFLTRVGFSCELFEAKSEPGGILRWGIPDYRLPKDVLAQEIRRIEDMGVSIRCNHPVTQDFLNTAAKDYDALFWGMGLAKSLKMNIPGEEMVGDGLEFLDKIQRGEVPSQKGKIAIIGGGNTAIDVARSLVRLGAEPVIVYRRRKQDMPAFFHEIVMAQKEGVEIRELLSPISVEADGNGYLLHLQGMRTGETGSDGRTSVIPDGDRTQTLRFSKICSGIGAKAEASWHLPGDGALRLSHCAMSQGEIPIIYGGDLVNPVQSVTDAVASGKQAAIALHTFFEHGWDAIEEKIAACQVGDGPSLSLEIFLGRDRKDRASHVVLQEEINTEYFDPSERNTPPVLPTEDATHDFSEIEGTFSAQSAREEAERCFNCGFCNECDNCRIFCPEVSVSVKNGTREINLEFCKGCGVCTVECPRSAMIMEEERI